MTRLAWIPLLMGLAASAARGEDVDCRPCHEGAGAPFPLPGLSGYYAEPGRHHPRGVSYPGPRDAQFRAPDRQSAELAWFDRNGNGTADPGEVQLFGPGRTVECASCHREHGSAAGISGPEGHLRVTQRDSALCRECHLK